MCIYEQQLIFGYNVVAILYKSASCRTFASEMRRELEGPIYSPHTHFAYNFITNHTNIKSHEKVICTSRCCRRFNCICICTVYDIRTGNCNKYQEFCFCKQRHLFKSKHIQLQHQYQCCLPGGLYAQQRNLCQGTLQDKAKRYQLG